MEKHWADRYFKKEMIYTKERIEKGEILAEGYIEEVRFVIVSLGSHPCAYVGVPKDHPLADHDYDLIPIDCHGGWTYASEGCGKYLPEGWYWYGWDYAHSGDFCGYHIGDPFWESHDKKWTTRDILEEVWSVCYDFAKLKKLAIEIKFGR